MPADRPSGENSQESGEVIEDAGSAGVENRSEGGTAMSAEEQEHGKRTQRTCTNPVRISATSGMCL